MQKAWVGASIARQRARDLFASLSIREPREIDIELIPAHVGAYVIYRPLKTAEGHLLRAGDRQSGHEAEANHFASELLSQH